MKKLLIGISGKMGSGKSTVAHMLQAAFQASGKVEILSMASPLYKAQNLLYTQYSLTLEGDKDRDLLIAVGQWGRDKHPDFWVEQFAKQIVKSKADVIICDDIRFKNEADFFKSKGLLFRLEGEQRGENVDEDKSSNITETALDDYEFDNIITNDKSPAEMCGEIANVMLGK